MSFDGTQTIYTCTSTAGQISSTLARHDEPVSFRAVGLKISSVEYLNSSAISLTAEYLRSAESGGPAYVTLERNAVFDSENNGNSEKTFVVSEGNEASETVSTLSLCRVGLVSVSCWSCVGLVSVSCRSMA